MPANRQRASKVTIGEWNISCRRYLTNGMRSYICRPIGKGEWTRTPISDQWQEDLYLSLALAAALRICRPIGKRQLRWQKSANEIFHAADIWPMAGGFIPELGLGGSLEVLWADRQVGVPLDPAVGVHVAGWPAAVHSFSVLAAVIKTTYCWKCVQKNAYQTRKGKCTVNASSQLRKIVRTKEKRKNGGYVDP